MTVEEIRKGQFVETDEVEEEPECVRLDSDPGSAFRNFLLPRLESARDEASREILAGVRDGRLLGDAVLDVIESFPASKTQRLRAWVKEASGTHVYAFVDFHGLYRLTYGLMMTTGGPRDPVVAVEGIGQSELESLVQYWEFSDALKEIKQNARMKIAWAFEEIPLVEVGDKEEYDEALAAMGISIADGAWEKSGLYDFRDSPPTYSGSVEDYERECMKYEAEQTLEYLFQGDEWMSACKTLLEG
jgi:hypothetical protein